MVSEFRVDLNTLVGGKRFDVLVCHTKLGVRTLNLDSCESIFRDAAPLLREHVIEEVSDRALAGTVLADENKSVVVDRNVYCPVPSVKALDLKLGQRRWHMEYWNANDITYLESAVPFATILDLCGQGQGPRSALQNSKLPTWSVAAVRRKGSRITPHKRARLLEKGRLGVALPGQSAALAQWVGAPLAAQRREIESRLHNRRARHFDALQIARPQTRIFGQAQRAVAGLKRRRAAIRHRVETHHTHANRVRVHAVQTSHDHTRAHQREHGRCLNGCDG